ncbi:helix-turn-helix domain-containing protein [Desulfovibrio sp. Fe33]|uniref:helix-turn-helix domain-containing protein n=1 Tax=Desulfovibrio sp. Fe33 TaxID=3020842 RepID=UPI00234CB6B2|nr:helix-turn-helix domain-containing protein [Desulfovibrio sp. Fe33]
MADIYTHKDLAALCGVSETTIKSYRRKFPGFIPVLTRGKPIRFKPEAGEVCLMIRDCFGKGMSVNETYKVLKEHFKEDRPARQRRARNDETAPDQADAVSAGVSQEYLERFFATAGQMMQGMAGLATAQAKAEHRLRKVETALEKLLEIEAENKAFFSRILERTAPAQAASASDAASDAMPATAATAQPSPEPKMRARKIVNVRGPEGDVDSYALEQDEQPSPERPSDAFLGTPIVIRNDQGEFLGVPGRLPLAGFLSILVDETDGADANWTRKENTWIFTVTASDGDTHALHFTSTTTPRGNLVILLDRLDVNHTRTSPEFLQEFFRQVKDKA